MEGGNDALNSLVPQAGRYHDLRPTIGLTDDEVLSFAGLEYGVNPALGDLRRLWEAGDMAAVYGVGISEQTRSHFVAQDATRSAQLDMNPTSGWLGRWLELTQPGNDTPLRAISLGSSTLAAQSLTGRPVAIQSVDGYRLAPPRGHNAVTRAFLSMAGQPSAGLLGQAQAAIPRTVTSANILQDVLAAESAIQDDFGSNLTSALFGVAGAIIEADIGTQVLYLTVTGFDTHASQRQLQERLLGDIAAGLEGLFARLEASGRARQVLAITVSEFGRRAAENASNGTDHGKGGLSFLCGSAVAGGTVTGHANLAELDDGDLPLAVDTRSLYASGLHWLGADAGLIDEVLGDAWEDLGLLQEL